MFSHSKATKPTRKTSGLFLLYQMDVNFSSRNNFANIRFLSKAVPVLSITPLIRLVNNQCVQQGLNNVDE